MANYLIGTDVGTGGTKSVLIDEEGKVLGSAYIEYGLITKRPGWAEQDPSDWWSAVRKTIRNGTGMQLQTRFSSAFPSPVSSRNRSAAFPSALWHRPASL